MAKIWAATEVQAHEVEPMKSWVGLARVTERKAFCYFLLLRALCWKVGQYTNARPTDNAK